MKAISLFFIIEDNIDYEFKINGVNIIKNNRYKIKTDKKSKSLDDDEGFLKDEDGNINV
jgi:hypothetical protein